MAIIMSGGCHCNTFVEGIDVMDKEAQDESKHSGKSVISGYSLSRFSLH